MAKDRYEIDFSTDPVFNSVTGLTNTTFDINNIRSGYMATEDQISQLYADIVRNEKRRDECCRDIIIWEAHVQIVRMNTLNIDATRNTLMGGGSVISTFDENVSVGTARRGLSYTVTFPIKWNSSLYVPRSVASNSLSGCGVDSDYSVVSNANRKIVIYRLVENNTLNVANCQATNNNYAKFWYGSTQNITSNVNSSPEGHNINPENNWGSFIHDIKDDGTVTITDHRRNTNFNVIRFYTQWIMRRTADSQLIPDPTFE